MIVPDQWPTIQAAVDALSPSWPPDTILVRGGDYPEHLLITRNLVVIGIPPLSGPDRRPRIEAITFGRNEETAWFEFEGLHFANAVILGVAVGPDRHAFRDCRFDAGLRTKYVDFESESTELLVTRCTWSDTVQVATASAFFDSCSAYAPLLLHSPYVVVRGSLFEDIAGAAVRLWLTEGRFSGNVVRGGGDGLVLEQLEETGIHIDSNRFERCAGDAVRSRQVSGSERITFERNRVLDCAGTGFRAGNKCMVRENVILGCGGPGLDLTQDEDPGFVERNVIGRCGGAGVRLFDQGTGRAWWSIRQNTIFSCAGPGLSISSEGGSTITNNLVVGNLGPGLDASINEQTGITCNNWFDNGPGGVAPAPTDLELDPLLCDVTSDDVSLRSDSPLLDSLGCGRIGTLRAGCEPGRPLALRVASPMLRTSSMQVAFTLPTQGEARLELLDLAGRRLRTRDVGGSAPGEQTVDLADGESLATGIYFIRLVQGVKTAQARVVFVR